jgi:hypothetical protein
MVKNINIFNKSIWSYARKYKVFQMKDLTMLGKNNSYIKGYFIYFASCYSFSFISDHSETTWGV